MLILTSYVDPICTRLDRMIEGVAINPDPPPPAAAVGAARRERSANVREAPRAKAPPPQV